MEQSYCLFYGTLKEHERYEHRNIVTHLSTNHGFHSSATKYQTGRKPLRGKITIYNNVQGELVRNKLLSHVGTTVKKSLQAITNI